jgi:hypothetical protein
MHPDPLIIVLEDGVTRAHESKFVFVPPNFPGYCTENVRFDIFEYQL